MSAQKIITKEECKEEVHKEREGDFCHIPGFFNPQQEEEKGVNKVSCLDYGDKERNQRWAIRCEILFP